MDSAPVSGFSVRIDKKTLDYLLDKFKCPSPDDLFFEKDVPYATIGSCAAGDTEEIPLFMPESGVNVDEAISNWLKDMNQKLGTSFTVEDVIFVSDLYFS